MFGLKYEQKKSSSRPFLGHSGDGQETTFYLRVASGVWLAQAVGCWTCYLAAHVQFPLLLQLVWLCHFQSHAFDHHLVKKQTCGCPEIAEKLLKGMLNPNNNHPLDLVSPQRGCYNYVSKQGLAVEGVLENWLDWILCDLPFQHLVRCHSRICM